MLSRLRKVINKRRIGLILFGVSFFYLMGVAGTDDYNTALHIYTPLYMLVIKTLIGILFMGIGVKLVNYGGDQDESSF